MRQQRPLSMVKVGVAFEVALPDDIANDAAARWARKLVEQAPDVRGMECKVFAVVVGGVLFVGDEKL